MKCIILAGGKGTRISEISKNIPKPMIKILGKPIILRIMEHYSKYGFRDFIIAAGYKKKIISNFFKKIKNKNWSVKVVDTGLNTMTGGRLKRLKKYINEKNFMMTYGDGLSNVNLKKLVNHHIKHQKYATLTAVRPPARFGGIKILGSKVKYFKEKSSLDEGWINGGFFVMEPEIFKFLKNEKTILERYPLEKISESKKLGAFKHYKNWQCMDTIRDKQILENLIKKKIF